MPQVYELTFDAYEPARRLFTGISYDTAFMDAVFEGRQQGRLFVDNPDAPRGAFLARTYDYFLAGTPTPSLMTFLTDAPAEPAVFDKIYGYVPTNAAWLNTLRRAQRLKVEEIPRRSFRLRLAGAGPHLMWHTDVPSHVKIKLITKALAEEIDEEMDETIGLFWGSYDAFAEGGFGRVAIIDGKPASVAYANVVSAVEANISVYTAEPFRREGLARLVCRAFIADTASRALDLTWDCDKANSASAALAISLGLTEEQSFLELGYHQRRTPDLSQGLWWSKPFSSAATIWTT
jgi:RimJ/RimL family protein N-acetyltransferase